MDTDNAISPGQVTVVTVTYGDRRHLLEQVLRAALAQEVGKIIVVNNGASWNVDALASTMESKVIVLNMDGNVGSAGGFSAGIARAIETDGEVIWLLDDDNLPNTDCLKELLHATNQSDSEYFIALAARPRMIANLNASATQHFFEKKSNYFLGIHILDIPRKIIKLLFSSDPKQVSAKCTDINVWTAPYGGLFFHKSLVNTIGLPKAELCLYVDDSEYTWRMVHHGYPIQLICRATINDIDDWEERSHGKFGMTAWLSVPSYRFYYFMRNQIWFAFHQVCKNKILFLFNGLIFFIVLGSVSILQGKFHAITTMYNAAYDGIFSRLGESYKYPLPGSSNTIS
ncbi:glycosyltransferase [Acidithiobacillus ferriphilus]|jgi:GT2 family glycosyltransferase|uniref:glycosyltransferase n=1 Tax=Acidithiobacillus ferriphilus TaxID=1689834 RepID=UPI0040567233